VKDDPPTVNAIVCEGWEGGLAGMVERTRVPVDNSTGAAPGTGRWYALTFAISASVVILVIDEIYSIKSIVLVVSSEKEDWEHYVTILAMIIT
jgi:hypothetical protein